VVFDDVVVSVGLQLPGRQDRQKSWSRRGSIKPSVRVRARIIPTANLQMSSTGKKKIIMDDEI